MLWSSIPKRYGHKKINSHVKIALYNWILHNLQVLKSPIAKICLKVSIYGHSEKLMVPKYLLGVSVQELYNIMVSTP